MLPEFFLMLLNFYPRPPRGGRPGMITPISRDSKISIHALREEGDHHQGAAFHDREISIHALREEGDPMPSSLSLRAAVFLSTPSARRATSWSL